MRAVIYTRVSTSSQVQEGISLELQEKRLLDYIKTHKMEFVGKYEDAGLSAKDTNRPAFQRMMMDVSLNKFDIIVVYKLDRISRSPADFHQLIRHLEQHNVDLVSVTQSFDTSTPHGRLMRNLLIDFAGFERELISERISEAMRKLRRDGRWPGGSHPPTGYDYDLKTKKLTINQEEAKIVRLIFDLYVNQRMGSTLIATYLNNQGLVGKKGQRWWDTVVRTILTRVDYIGKKEVVIDSDGNTTIVDGQQPPIIDETLFKKAQMLLKDRSKFRPRARRKGLLTGELIYCGYCGSTLTHFESIKPRKKTGQKYIIPYYRCSGYRKEANYCHRAQLTRTDLIEPTLFEKLSELASQKEVLKEAFEAMKKRTSSDLKPFTEKKRNLEARERDIQAKSKKLLMAYEQDIISIDQLRQRNVELKAQSEHVKSEISKLEYQLMFQTPSELDYKIVIDGLKTFAQNIEKLTFSEKRKILKAAIKRIDVFHDEFKVEYMFPVNKDGSKVKTYRLEKKSRRRQAK